MNDVTDRLRNIGRAQEISRQAMVHGASQDAHELHVVVELLLNLGPQVIVELGCDRGGTLSAWNRVCDRVYGITWTKNADSGGARCESFGAEVRYGDTHDPASLSWLREKLDGDLVDVLVVDGDHHLDGVTADLADYGPLVRPGGLIMMHDVLPEQYPGVQVWRLWPRLRARYQTELIGTVFGWGIIHVRPGDEFGHQRHARLADNT